MRERLRISYKVVEPQGHLSHVLSWGRKPMREIECGAQDTVDGGIDRPPKKRKKSTAELADEMMNSKKLTRTGKSVTYSLCKQVGHNQRGCKSKKSGLSGGGSQGGADAGSHHAGGGLQGGEDVGGGAQGGEDVGGSQTT
ncbi:hypothetical protein Tco_0337635 [Tanacetum coccineum]